MYNRSREVSFSLFVGVIIATGSAALLVWDQVFLTPKDSWAETVRAISREIGGPVPITILLMGNLEVIMVISRYIIELYRKEREAAAEARGIAIGEKRGRAQVEKWRDWYNRMMEAKAKDEDFDEPPPLAAPSQD